jgi:hypothetical protein
VEQGGALGRGRPAGLQAGQPVKVAGRPRVQAGQVVADGAGGGQAAPAHEAVGEPVADSREPGRGQGQGGGHPGDHVQDAAELVRPPGQGRVVAVDVLEPEGDPAAPVE